MTIVCATHLTAASAAAVTVAAHLARRTGHRLILATVLPGHGLGALALADGLDQDRQRLSTLGLEVDVALLHGKMERAVGRLCSDVGARLLVVGDRARDAFFSTPAERLAWAAPVPLLVVRGDGPFQAWQRGERALTVLLGSDSPRLAPPVLEWLTWLAAAGPLDVLATEVWDPGDAGDLEARVEHQLHDLRASLLGLPLAVATRARVEFGRGGVGEVLPRIAAREKVDLVVMETQPTRGLLARRSSLAHEVLRHASTSVALVPRLADESVEALSRASPTSPRTLNYGHRLRSG